MADLIELDLVVRDKGLKASVSTVERLERQIIKAQKAVDQNTISQARYNKILLAAKRDYQALGMSSQRATAQVRAFAAANKTAQAATSAQTVALNSATVATNRLSAAQSQTKNKMNGTNMAIQQAGYQFGDFAVQVQGGTSAFVAFSQQGTQLAGILPMIAGPLGLTVGAATLLSSALMILIPIGSAIGRMFMEMKDKSRSAADGVKSFEDRLKSARGEVNSMKEALELLNSGFENKAVKTLSDRVDVAKAALKDAADEIDKMFTPALKNAIKSAKALGSAYTSEQITELANNLRKLQSPALREKLAAATLELAIAKELVRQDKNRIRDQSVINQLVIAREILQKQSADAQEKADGIQRVNAVAYFKAEQQIQTDLHKIWIANNKAENKARLDSLSNEKKSRRLAGIAFFKQEQGLENDIHQVRVKNILLEAALREATISAARAKFNANSANVMLSEGKSATVETEALAKRIKELQAAWKEANREVKKGGVVIKDTRTAYEKAAMTAKEFADTLDRQVIGAVDSVSDAFSSFLQSGLKDFKDFVKSIGDSFFKLLSDMAAAALRRQILIPIATGMAAGFGSAAAASSMASGTGAFAAGGIGASLATGASNFGSAALSTMTGGAMGSVTAGSTMASIGAAVPYIAAAIAVIGLFSKKTKLLDSGLRTTVEGFDVAIATFNKTQSSRLFGLLKGSKITKYEAASPDDAIPLMKAVGDLQQSIVDAAGTLGIGAEAFDKFSYEFKLSLQGLTEEQKIQKVNEEIVKLGDSFASMTVHFKTMNELMAVAQQRYDLTTRLLQLQGKEEELITRQRDLERSATHELNIETLEQIYALEDLARAVDETTGAIGNAAEALALQGRKLKALGDQEDILAFTRQNELDVVNELNKELLLEVHTLEDLALGLTNTKKAAEDAEKELRGFNDAVDAAASELKDLLDESLDAALGGLERAIDARKDTIDQKFDSLISGLEDRLSAAENTAQASSEIYQILSGALQGRSLSGASFAGREAARSYVSGGGTDADKLRSAVGVLAEPSAQLFGSFEEYARDFAITSNVLKQSKDVAEAQMTADEQAVELLKEQIEKGGRDRDDQLRVLDEQLEAAQLQIDTLKGIDVSIVSVDAAMKTVRDAMTTYEQTQANHSQLNSSVLSIQEAINNLAGAVGQQAAALAASAAAAQAQADAANAANAVGMQVTTSQSGAQTDVNSSVAQTALSRAIKISAETPKTSAEQASLDRFTGGVRPDHIKLAIAAGKRFDPSAGGYRHFASGGLHTGGLRMVGERGPELEVTSPSRIYSNSQTRSMMSNPELVTEIKELRKEISETKMEQRAASIATVKYNKRTSDQLRTWNSVGLPPERTA